MSAPERETVLLVEDDAVYLSALGRALDRAGYTVKMASSLAEAEAILAHEAPDRAVVDLKLGDGSGMDLLSRLQEAGAVTVVLTGHGTIPSAVEAMRAGAVDFLTKPVSTTVLLASLGREPAPSQSRLTRLDAVEQEAIARTLAECGGNVSRAARRLGINRRTLQRKLKSQSEGS